MNGTSPLRLALDGTALAANWRWLAAQSGRASCGAAIKADGYGLGARPVMERLAREGCRDFFVTTWDEVRALGAAAHGLSLSVLHGVRDVDMVAARSATARPTLNTAEQVARWKQTGGAPCDVMVDTGMNRLGLAAEDVANGLLDGLNIDTLMSHLASADEPSAQNERQRAAFAALAGRTGARRMSLANSAGICLGPDYHFDLTRPGLALYGGIPRGEAAGHIVPVVRPQAQVIQRRRIAAGESVGYNATFTAERPMDLAILNIGYADGYLRGFSNRGAAADGRFPVIGRVSMDLVAISVDQDPTVAEGDWISLDYALPQAANQSGLSQYELLTVLGDRFDRIWT
ncbi:MAG: alanine racemase [Rhodocyclaceae bacterium]|nr:MAG: alanine racemase [Rhodocyclaceae bacterium]